MRWLELYLGTAAGVGLALAYLDLLFFLGYACHCHGRARRMAALTLAAVCFAFALEAAAFLALAALPMGATAQRLAAQLAVRTASLTAVGAISLLVWRGRRYLRR